jgi:hypothetical protein
MGGKIKPDEVVVTCRCLEPRIWQAVTNYGDTVAVECPIILVFTRPVKVWV